jgi:hypothetical protein
MRIRSNLALAVVMTFVSGCNCQPPEPTTCGENAVLSSRGGEEVCSCVTGYAGDGGTCTDIDECAGEATGCSADALCTNLPGSSSCTCKPGYVGDGGTCADVAASISGLRWNIPCIQIGPTACTCVDPASVSATLSGTPGAQYDVTLRFRGVVEQKTYTGGTNDGAWWQEGGLAPNDGNNIYRLGFSSPEQTFYLNRGTSAISRAWAIDYTKTIRAAAGAVVSLSATAGDGLEILNRDSALSSGSPIVVPGVPPAPEAFNGQFIQMDVVSVVLVP